MDFTAPEAAQNCQAMNDEPLLPPENFCSRTPNGRMILATDVPDSVYLKANVICSSVSCFFPIRKTHPF